MTSSALALSNGPVPGVPAVRCLGPARLTAGLDRYLITSDSLTTIIRGSDG